jgi:Domain of unknown function (DUF4258)
MLATALERGPDFLRLVNALSALYPQGYDEKRLLDAMLLAAVRCAMAEPVDEYRISSHAIVEMERRGIDETMLRTVLAAPEQRYTVRTGRDVLQSRIAFGDKIYLVRVFVDVDRKPADVVTAYRTSNVARYWRAEP